MENLDTRVRFTKAVLQQSLLKILKTKNIDKVTIKEICEEAKLNRGTFYLHYQTPNDLLMEIEQKFIDENMAYFTPYMQYEKTGYERSQLAGMFTCIFKNREMCQILMGRNGNPKFLDRLEKLIRPTVVNEWCLEFPEYRREDLDYTFDFIFAGAMRLILNWIDDDRGLSTAELALRLDRLGHSCHLAISEFQKQ